MAIQTGCLGALHREQSLTAPRSCGMLVFNKNIIWNVLNVMISTSKRSKMRFLPLSHLFLCTKTCRDLLHAKSSLKYLKFSLRYTMRNMFAMFSFAFWVNITQSCEVDNFLKFELAGIPIRLFKY